jgi:hypothetical protein
LLLRRCHRAWCSLQEALLKVQSSSGPTDTAFFYSFCLDCVDFVLLDIHHQSRVAHFALGSEQHHDLIC